MNKAAQFIRRHALAILVVAVALAVPFGVASAKYTTTKTVSENIEVNVNVKTYTIDRTKFLENVTALNSKEGSEAITSIKFVKGSDSAISALTSTIEVQDDTASSGKIGVFISGTDVYIAPMAEDDSGKPATTVNASMFAPTDCNYLLSQFKMSTDESVTDPELTIDLSNLNTSKVTNMSGMFSENERMTSLVFGSGFTTSKVTNMSYMFNGLSLLETLDVSKFDTSNVENMYCMFNQAVSLKTLTLSDKFTTSKVTNMEAMFRECYVLEQLDVSKFDTSNVPNMAEMFAGCHMLQMLDLSSFDTSKVTNMEAMFDGDYVLKTIYASNKFVVDQVTNSDNMFFECRALVGGNSTACDGSSNVTASYAHIDVEGNPGYFTGK